MKLLNPPFPDGTFSVLQHAGKPKTWQRRGEFTEREEADARMLECVKESPTDNVTICIIRKKQEGQP